MKKTQPLINKVFFIGMNKTATTHLHHYIINNYNIYCLHYEYWDEYLNDYTIFMDGVHYDFEKYDNSGNIFILNTRPIFKWLLSCIKHKYQIENITLDDNSLKDTIYNLYFERDVLHKKIIDYFKDKQNLYILNVENIDKYTFLHEILVKTPKSEDFLHFEENDNICDEKNINPEYLNKTKLIISNLINEFKLHDNYSELLFNGINKYEIEKHKYLL